MDAIWALIVPWGVLEEKQSMGRVVLVPVLL